MVVSTNAPAAPTSSRHATRRVLATPSGRSSPCQVSTRPRCGRHASQRSIWQRRARGLSHLGLRFRTVDL